MNAFIQTPLLLRRAILLSFILAAAAARAGVQYNNQDVLIGIRQASGTSELTVNAGSVSNFIALPIGNSITITQLTSVQLWNAFPDLNDVSWSVSAAQRTNNNLLYT